MMFAANNSFVTKLNGHVGLSEPEKMALAKLTSQPRGVTRKVDIVRDGEGPGPFFVMLEGWAVRYKLMPDGARQITAFLMPGDTCDLYADMVDEMDNSVQTVTDSSIAFIARRNIRDVMASSPAIARAMYVNQQAKEATSRAWIVSMGQRSSIERVAHLLCELHIRARAIHRIPAGGLELPLSQVLLADALGMTTVHINRTIRTLRMEGAITSDGGGITIVDPDKLVRIGGFSENYLQQARRRRRLDEQSA